jgi:hypothetical protein|tara:strand:- start:1174 stop:1389 length:216 start_codon:yes stop_codon:yes gene_type:complete
LDRTREEARDDTLPHTSSTQVCDGSTTSVLFFKLPVSSFSEPKSGSERRARFFDAILFPVLFFFLFKEKVF